MRRIVPLVAVFLAVVGFLAPGCESGSTSGRGKNGATAFVDDLGDTLRLASTPARIVSLAPNITEMIYLLGADDRLVGVTDVCDWPPEARNKPRVTGFNPLNVESIVAARPDVIVANRGNAMDGVDALRSAGAPVYAVEVSTVADLSRAIRALGRVLGVPARGDSIARSWEERLARVAATIGDVPAERRPIVFFGGTEEPIFSAGPGSFIADLIERAGGRNLLADASTAWPRIDLETLVARDPDVVIVSAMGSTDADALLAMLRTAPGWRSLTAVREGRIIAPGDAIMREGPRLIDAFEGIARALYPERFGKPSAARPVGGDAG